MWTLRLKSSRSLLGMIAIAATASAADLRAQAPSRLSITNGCSFTVWMQSLANHGYPALSEGIVALPPRARHDYAIPSSEWAGRFWPKLGCDARGENCAAGEEIQPCPPGGCQPPADTKVEFFYPESGSRLDASYDISLVDGYSLAMRITPRGVSSGSCVETQCQLSLADCPTNETLGLGDLRVMNAGAVVQCLSPCKKWNYTAPYGKGQPETVDPGLHFCCPTPPVSPGECREGPVVSTKYVQTVRAQCPTAYSFAYDDEGGLHFCPSTTSFDVALCPAS